LCRLGADVLALVQRRDVPGRTVAAVCATILAGTAGYGFVFGCWHSWEQALYSACKLPLLFFGTVLVSALINTMLAQVLGAALSFRQVCTAMFLGMGIAAAILGALCPVMGFFVLQVTAPGSSLVGLDFHAGAVTPARNAYWGLLLGHVGVIGMAGILGNVRLYRVLRGLVPTRRMAGVLMATWLSVAGFVGCEMSWLLSPFLCKPTQAPHIIPREYFEENFYERVWRGMMELDR
jgi:hypothetical protein